MISNYLWDAEKNKNIFGPLSDGGRPATDWLRLKTLRRLFTTGCNIPLFIAGLDERESFAKPNAEFQWDNYYDADDVLGWPLRQLGPSFDMVDDHDINVGGIFTSWNPLSHRDYWSDRDVIRPLADALMSLLP